MPVQPLQKSKVNLTIGYKLQNIDFASALFVVPTLQLERYCKLLIHLTAGSDINVELYDSAKVKFYGKQDVADIVLFAIDLWPFYILKDYFYQINVRRDLKSNIHMHALGDIHIGSYNAPRYNLRPFLQQFQQMSWFPKITSMPRPAHLCPQERNIDSFKDFLNEHILDEDVMHKKDRLSPWNSYVFMTYSEQDRQNFYAELSTSDLFPNDPCKFKIYDRVQTPNGFLTQINRISYHGAIAQTAYKKNYENYLLFLQNPISQYDTLTFHPCELRDAFVMRFHWVTGPIQKVLLYGKWPTYAIDQIRALTTTEIAFHPNFQQYQVTPSDRKNSYGAIINDERLRQKNKRQAQQQTQLAAELDLKKKRIEKLKMVARKQHQSKLNEAASLSSENM